MTVNLMNGCELSKNPFRTGINAHPYPPLGLIYTDARQYQGGLPLPESQVFTVRRLRLLWIVPDIQGKPSLLQAGGIAGIRSFRR